MIKIKGTYRELEALCHYAQACMVGKNKTADRVKEYMLAHSLKMMHRRLYNRGNNVFHEFVEGIRDKKGKEKSYTVKIENDEVLALCIYFKRMPVPVFLQPLEHSILTQVPKDVSDIMQSPVPHGDGSTWDVSVYLQD